MAEVNPLATLQGFEWGANLMSDRLDRDARQQAGQALSAGDYGAAGQALGGRGMLDEQVALMGLQRQQETADRDRATGEREQTTAFMLDATNSMLAAPEPRRVEIYNAIRPTLARFQPPEVMAELDRVAQTPGGLGDDNLRSLVMALGGEGQSQADPYEGAPSGYRWVFGPNGERVSLEPIPNGPATRPIMTPYGILQPMGGGGQGGGGDLVDTLPWETPTSPSQPGGGQPRPGSERSQTPTVSFGNSNEARNAINRIVPGVTFTSGPRTPAQNRAAGGAARSYHLSNRAWDLVPPQGMTMAQLADLMRQQGFRVLNEGDHVHVSW